MFNEVYPVRDLDGELFIKIIGVDENARKNVLNYVREHVPQDLEPYFIKAVKTVPKIVIAKPFTTYSWLLALRLTASYYWENKALIVYYNSEDFRWTIANLLKELALIGLPSSGLITGTTIAYAAVYRSGLLELYKPIINEAIDILSKCTVAGEILNLLLDTIPKIIATKLYKDDFNRLSYLALQGDNDIIRYWLSKNPSFQELRAVSTALKINGLNPISYGILYECPYINVIERNKDEIDLDSLCKDIEGVDENFCKMLKILEKIIEDPENAWNILAPWRRELEPIKDYIESFITEVKLHGY